MGQTPQKAPAAPSGGGLEPHVAALLGYLFAILAIVWLVVEPYKNDRFIRFHAFQSLAFAVVIFALSIALTILSIILAFIPYVGAIVGLLLWPVFGLAIFVAWILLMVKAYNKQMWKLPVIGDFCEKQAGA